MTQINQFWDPTGQSVDQAKISQSKQKIEKIYTQVSAHPNRIKWQLITFVVISLIIGLLILVWLVNHSFDPQNLKLLIYPFSFLYIPLLLYFTRFQGVQKDLTKLMVANQRNWIYSPEIDVDRITQLTNLYPEIFKKGNLCRDISQQFWGNFENQAFWLGQFHYEIYLGRFTKNVYETTYALPLAKKVETELVIVSETKVTRLADHFTHGDLNLESNEFNRLFRLEFNHQEIDKGAKIYQLLNPAVMVALIDLRYTAGSFRLLLRDQILIINFNQIWQLKHTDFFGRIMIDPRDIKSFDTQLNQTLNLTQKMVESLD